MTTRGPEADDGHHGRRSTEVTVARVGVFDGKDTPRRGAAVDETDVDGSTTVVPEELRWAMSHPLSTARVMEAPTKHGTAADAPAHGNWSPHTR